MNQSDLLSSFQNSTALSMTPKLWHPNIMTALTNPGRLRDNRSAKHPLKSCEAFPVPMPPVGLRIMTINPSSRTPEGSSNRCPICGHHVRIDPSKDTRDAPCPKCGQLLWFVSSGLERSLNLPGGKFTDAYKRFSDACSRFSDALHRKDFVLALSEARIMRNSLRKCLGPEDSNLEMYNQIVRGLETTVREDSRYSEPQNSEPKLNDQLRPWLL